MLAGLVHKFLTAIDVASLVNTSPNIYTRVRSKNGVSPISLSSFIPTSRTALWLSYLDKMFEFCRFIAACGSELDNHTRLPTKSESKLQLD